MDLTPDQFNQVIELFDDLPHHISIQGVLTGGLPGRVFTSDDHSSVLLTSPQGIFLGGRPNNDQFLQEMNSLLKNELLPGRASTDKDVGERQHSVRSRLPGSAD